jgi:hypothetical protein
VDAVNGRCADEWIAETLMKVIWILYFVVGLHAMDEPWVESKKLFETN